MRSRYAVLVAAGALVVAGLFGSSPAQADRHKPNHVPHVQTQRVYVSDCDSIDVFLNDDPIVCVNIDYDRKAGGGFYIARVQLFASAQNCLCGIDRVNGYQLWLINQNGNIFWSKDATQTNFDGGGPIAWNPGYNTSKGVTQFQVIWSGRVFITGHGGFDFSINRWHS